MFVGVEVHPGAAAVGSDFQVVTDEGPAQERGGLGLIGDRGDPLPAGHGAVVVEPDQLDVLELVEDGVEAVGVPDADDRTGGRIDVQLGEVVVAPREDLGQSSFNATLAWAGGRPKG